LVNESSDFADPLIQWYNQNKRPLPWRLNQDPYRIWISEIMLQQTRVDQAIPYFLRFIKAFPTVEDLALASQHDVFMLWEGLGYYSRARNLHSSAKRIVAEFGGKLPENADDIKSLKGIGEYTAAAVLSIAYNQKYAVVDGNVIRVVTRYLGIESDIRLAFVKNQVQRFVDGQIPSDYPSEFNQAMMELGATICTPKKPNCEECPIQLNCIGYQSARTDTIPYKSPAKKVPHHNIIVGVIENEDGKILIAKRPENTMLGGLWEFPGGKKEKGESEIDTLNRELFEELGVKIHEEERFFEIKHAYSHFKITLVAYKCKLKNGTPEPMVNSEIKWVNKSELLEYPFPKANRNLTLAIIAS
jgi:A/G-specific adenine glycosylase